MKPLSFILAMVVSFAALALLSSRNESQPSAPAVVRERPKTPPPTEPRPVPSPIAVSARCRGYTWVVRRQEGGVVQVGSDARSNAYSGDAPCEENLPVLCVHPIGLKAPDTYRGDFYNAWFGAELKLSKPIRGTTLHARTVADDWCQAEFGNSEQPGEIRWRMAEHHDGGGGWGFGGVGEIDAKDRFWVAINDQPANPWSHQPQ
jgi:hypothetical protein